MRYLVRGTLAVAGVLVLAACSATGTPAPAAGAPATIAVVASTNVWGNIAATVGGNAVSVTSIISNPNQDPHVYEADARVRLELARAKLVIDNGGGYDSFVNTLLNAGSNKPTVLNAVDISGFAQGPSLNEHVWYDLPTVAKVADAIASALSRQDPARAAMFAANATAFKAQLTGLGQREAALKSRYAGVGVAITEPLPVYLLTAIGLHNLTPAAFSKAVEDGTDAPASVLEQVLSLFASKQAKLIVYNEQTVDPQTQRVLAAAKAAQVQVVAMTETLPAGMNYVGWMTTNIAAVGTALAR